MSETPSTPPVDSPPTVDQGDAPSSPPEPAEDGAPKTFDEAYVKKLREEAAGNRVKFGVAQKRLLEASIRAEAADLQDPSDLLTFTNEPDLLDEEGLPDPEKIRAATDELIKRKPHLARAVYNQDVGQGPRGRVEPAPRTLNDIIKMASG